MAVSLVSIDNGDCYDIDTKWLIVSLKSHENLRIVYALVYAKVFNAPYLAATLNQHGIKGNDKIIKHLCKMHSIENCNGRISSRNHTAIVKILHTNYTYYLLKYNSKLQNVVLTVQSLFHKRRQMLVYMLTRMSIIIIQRAIRRFISFSRGKATLHPIVDEDPNDHNHTAADVSITDIVVDTTDISDDVSMTSYDKPVGDCDLSNILTTDESVVYTDIDTNNLVEFLTPSKNELHANRDAQMHVNEEADIGNDYLSQQIVGHVEYDDDNNDNDAVAQFADSPLFPRLPTSLLNLSTSDADRSYVDETMSITTTASLLYSVFFRSASVD